MCIELVWTIGNKINTHYDSNTENGVSIKFTTFKNRNQGVTVK